MRIVVAASGADLDAPFACHFGRAETFVIFDTVTAQWETYPNPAVNARSNNIISHDVQAAISGDFGPHAVRMLTAEGIQLFQATWTVSQVLADFQDGKLKRLVLPDPAWEGY
jgi:predicted Fe-Mo cluster-binding NifX family protein